MNYKPITAGFIASSLVDITSIPLAHVNAVLQTISLLLGISLGTITLYHALRGKEWKQLDNRLKRIESRCLAAFPRESTREK
jgi:ABC-type nickel/cobalt efflux system permease component RcnA